MSSPDVWILHTDGAAKGNPGRAGIGIALYKPGNRAEPAYVVAERILDTTNNVAEYLALIRGLKEALLRGAERVEARTDSELMARQIAGRYKVTAPQILPLHGEAKALLSRFASAQVVHVPREQNAIADKLANQGVAQKIGEKPSAPAPAKAVPAKPFPAAPVPQWNVERLWEAAQGLPVEKVPVAQFTEWLDSDCWFAADAPATIRRVADHARRIYAADLSRPILLDPEGGLVDGSHRLARAYLEGHTEIAVVRLRELPAPDRHVS